MTNHFYSLLTILCGAQFVAGVAVSQTNPITAQMTAQQFETWIISSATVAENSVDKPEFCRIVIDRLRSERYVTSQTIMHCVESFVRAAENRAKTSPGDAAQNRFDAAFSFINEARILLSDRRELQARLNERAGSLWVTIGDFGRAAQSFETSLSVIEPFHLEVDLQRMRTLVSLGQSLLSLNRKKEAEIYFSQALSYTWYTILNHPNEMRALRDQYVLAGHGLIQSRRGNLAALQEITFVPATQKELGPALQAAIQEVKDSAH